MRAAAYAGYLGGLFGIDRRTDPLRKKYAADCFQRYCFIAGHVAGQAERFRRIRTGEWVWLKGCWTYPAPTRAEDNPLWPVIEQYRRQQDLAA